MNSDIPVKYLTFFNAVSEGTVSESQLSELNGILSTDKVACEYYLEYMNMCAVLKGGKVINEEFSLDSGEFESPSVDSLVGIESNVSLRGIDLCDLNFDGDADESKAFELNQALLELLDMERTSPSIDTRRKEPERELIQNVESDFKLIPGSPSKFILRTLFALAACLTVFIGYLQFFVPIQVDLPVVATLCDAMEVVWDTQLQVPDEFGYMVQSKYGLKKGYASILFNNGAKVTVEAPAELSLSSSGDMELIYGRIYAIVPEKAHGFTVMAASSKIVDLGTEFGVELDERKAVQLHVTKGRTMLLAGLLNGKKEQADVNAGEAKKVYSDGFVKDIPIARQKFARRIDSRNCNIVRRDPVEVIYEPFDYPAGQLDGKSGASEIGLEGAWVANETTLVDSESLNFGDLIGYSGSIGNLSIYSNRFGGGRAINPSALADNGLLDDGATLWFSLVLGYGHEANTTNARLAFALANNNFNNGRFSYSIEDAGLQTGSGIGLTLGRLNGVNGQVFATRFYNHESGEGFSGNLFGDSKGTSLYKAGQYGLIVGKIVWGKEHDVIELYQPGLTLNPGLPISSLKTNVDQSTFNSITFCRGDSVVLDEIRFGKSYSDVLGGRYNNAQSK